MMNVLVTGSSGFIGREVATLLSTSHKVYGVSRSVDFLLPFNQYNLDILDTNQLTQIMCEKSIDMVVHCAGKAIVSDCARNPYNAIMSNGMGTASVLESSRLAKVKRIISIETDKVYGYQTQIPTDESAVPNPNSPYEFSKVIASEMNEFYRKEYGLDVIAVRPVNVFGGSDPNVRIIPRIFESIIYNKPIPIHSDAVNAMRDYIYVKDVARMIALLLLTKPSHNVYNFSAGYNFTVSDLVERVKKVLTYSVPGRIIDKVGKYSEIPFQVIDGSRFTEEYDFKFTDFDTSIRESFEEFKVYAGVEQLDSSTAF